jgi:hypothetical protein
LDVIYTNDSFDLTRTDARFNIFIDSRVLCHSNFGDVSFLGYEYWRKRVFRCPTFENSARFGNEVAKLFSSLFQPTIIMQRERHFYGVRKLARAPQIGSSTLEEFHIAVGMMKD